MNTQIPNPIQYLETTHYSSKLILFSSFDLTGSTLFKSENAKEWPTVFFAFFERMYNEVTNFIRENNSFKTWKLEGDEILFSFEVRQLATIEEAISHLYKTLAKVSVELPPPLDLKTSVWLAYIDDIINKELPEDFLGTFTEDYIGATIDEGFRISTQFCRPQQLVLSFDLAYVLLNTSAKDFIFCVGYKRLKGIWNNRYCPIFWYTENYEGDVSKTPYDIEYDCEMTQSFIHEREHPQLAQLKKIMRELEKGGDSIRSKHFQEVQQYLNLAPN